MGSDGAEVGLGLGGWCWRGSWCFWCVGGVCERAAAGAGGCGGVDWACWLGSAGGGERADAVEGVGVVAVPGPAGWEVERPAAGVAGQAAGDAQQPAAQGAGGAVGCVGEPEQLCPSEQVVCEHGEHGPGGVGVELAGGEVRESLVFEVGDDLLDDGVVAVLGLDERELFAAVGEEAEVAPVGPQFGLGADQAGAPDDQPPAAVASFRRSAPRRLRGSRRVSSRRLRRSLPRRRGRS